MSDEKERLAQLRGGPVDNAFVQLDEDPPEELKVPQPMMPEPDPDAEESSSQQGRATKKVPTLTYQRTNEESELEGSIVTVYTYVEDG